MSCSAQLVWSEALKRVVSSVYYFLSDGHGHGEHASGGLYSIENRVVCSVDPRTENAVGVVMTMVMIHLYSQRLYFTENTVVIVIPRLYHSR